jgi:hypothetical protein
MLPAVTADTARHIGGIGAVLEVVPVGCRQGGLQLLRPFLVGPDESADLVWGSGRAHGAQSGTLSGIDAVKELLADLDG